MYSKPVLPITLSGVLFSSRQHLTAKNCKPRHKSEYYRLKINQENMPYLLIIAFYRPWKNINGLSQETAFENHVNEMNRLIPTNNDCMCLGDFNLNYAKMNNQNL